MPTTALDDAPAGTARLASLLIVARPALECIAQDYTTLVETKKRTGLFQTCALERLKRYLSESRAESIPYFLCAASMAARICWK